MFGKRKKALNGASRLRGLAFFEGFSDAELDRVAELAVDVEIEAGELLIDQGRVGQECYVIESGEAEVFVGEDLVAASRDAAA